MLQLSSVRNLLRFFIYYYCYYALVFEQASAEISPIITAGSAGGALFFDARRADIVSQSWKNSPPNEYTVELWFQMYDPQSLGTPLSYSVYDTRSIPYQEIPTELLLFFGPDAICNWKHSTPVNYSPQSLPNETYPLGWHHYAITFSIQQQAIPGENAPFGAIRFYIDGIPVKPIDTGGGLPDSDPYNFMTLTDTMGLLPNGCFIMGQRAGNLCKSFDPTFALSGTIDEFRKN